MNLDQMLRENDPARDDDHVDVAQLRRRLMTAPARPHTVARLAAACVLLVLLSVAVVSLRERAGRTSGQLAQRPPLHEPVARQLQISAPGGTRLIWTFRDDFSIGR